MIRRLVAVVLVALAFANPAAARDRFASDRISVAVEGSGPDVVLIPGLTSQPRVWSSTVAAVPGYRYHRVHVAGFAGKPAGANASGPVVAPVAEEVARYIAEAGLRRPAIVGHSMGGSIGLMLAARHPERVGRVMVVDMMPFMGSMFGPPGTTPATVEPIADKLASDMRSATPELRRAQLTAVMANMTTNEAERAAAIEDGTTSDPAVVASSYRELIVTDLGPELSRITAPTTVLYVTPRGVPLTDAQIDGFMRAAYAPLGGAKLVRIPDSAHFIMADAPERFRQELRGFLAR